MPVRKTWHDLELLRAATVGSHRRQTQIHHQPTRFMQRASDVIRQIPAQVLLHPQNSTWADVCTLVAGPGAV